MEMEKNLNKYRSPKPQQNRHQQSNLIWKSKKKTLKHSNRSSNQSNYPFRFYHRCFVVFVFCFVFMFSLEFFLAKDTTSKDSIFDVFVCVNFLSISSGQNRIIDSLFHFLPRD
ncbi:disks large-associated protein 5 [Sarcoptes scabiei]|nr:disks large-associated protein 5 [Sarcoptes scabiei]